MYEPVTAKGMTQLSPTRNLKKIVQNATNRSQVEGEKCDQKTVDLQNKTMSDFDCNRIGFQTFADMHASTIYRDLQRSTK